MGKILKRFLYEAVLSTLAAFVMAGLAVVVYGNYGAYRNVFWIYFFISLLLPVGKLILRVVDRVRYAKNHAKTF